MSAQPMESAPSSVLPERVALTLVPSLADGVHLRLQEHLGGDRELLEYDVELRKEYVGPASRKVQVGGALVVSLTVASGEDRDISVDRHEINDNNRPFDEGLIVQLGRIAELNWYKGKGWRVDL